MYDYREAVKENIREYLRDTTERDESTLYDDLFVENSVTGNEWGYADEKTCREYVGPNIHLFFEAAREFGISLNDVADKKEIYSYMDTMIRCYLLGECLSEVLEEEVNFDRESDYR